MNSPREPSESQSSQPAHRPHVPADRNLPEITIKAVLLGIGLSIALAGANAYLGLLAGMTVSASIPAAVISMAALRLFRQSNILENNIVQTAASAGESLAAGVIFTFPALILLGVWTDFNYWQTTIIAALGGLIGVLFTIPLRRALVVEHPLTFPEGVATAEVLKAGDAGGGGIRNLATGSVLGACFKLGESGLRLWTQALEGAWRTGSSLVYLGSNLLPSLVAVGYIVGFNIAVLVFLGGALNWFVAIPIAAATHPWPAETSALDFAYDLWSTQTRYLGVGAMLVGGLWALIRIGRSLVFAIMSGFQAYGAARRGGPAPERTDRDTPMQWVLVLVVVSALPLFLVFDHFIQRSEVAAFMTVVMLVAGFLFSAVASYMAGLVGSSNNPISGVTIATLLTSALLLAALLGPDASAGPGAAILIGAVVCCAAAIGGDNMQDLKAGYLLGATPARQQIMQAVGVVAAAFVVAPILSLLLHAYGIVTPVSPDREALAAPQATLMASVSRGVFEQNLPWTLVGIGMLVAIGVILLDCWLEYRGMEFRTPVLAVAVGIYLPLELATAMLVGGLIAWAARRAHARAWATHSGEARKRLAAGHTAALKRGLLLAAGLITGEALVGILLAIPIVWNRGVNPLDLSSGQGIGRLIPEGVRDSMPSLWPGLAFMAVVIWLLYRTSTSPAPPTTIPGNEDSA